MSTKIIIILSGIILTLVVIILVFSKNNENTNIEKGFPWDERTTFIIYAGNSEDINPDKNTPSLIVPEYDADKNFMNVDGVPYLSVLNKDQMLEEIENFTINVETKSEILILNKIRAWVKAKIEENYKYFLYELEPPEFAGEAYPIAVEAEKEMD